MGGQETIRSEDYQTGVSPSRDLVSVHLAGLPPKPGPEPDPYGTGRLQAEIQTEIEELREQLLACNRAWRDTLYQLSKAQEAIGAAEAKPRDRQSGDGPPIAAMSNETWGKLLAAPPTQRSGSNS